MYQNSVAQRAPDDEEDRWRRDTMTSGNAYNAHSPPPNRAQYPPSFPASNGGPLQRPTFASPYHPPTPAPLPFPSANRSPSQQHHQPPLSPVNGRAPSDPPFKAGYYDPTVDAGDRPSRTYSNFSRQSPNQTAQNRNSYNTENSTDAPPFGETSHFSSQNSPVAHSSHSHPPGGVGSLPHSPVKPTHGSPSMAYMVTSTPPPRIVDVSPQPAKSTRPADPMAFSSILSNSNPEPAAPSPKSSTPVVKEHSRKPSRASVASNNYVEESAPRPGSRRTSHRMSTPTSDPPMKTKINGETKPLQQTSQNIAKSKVPAISREAEILAEMARIEDAELSDLDVAEFENPKLKYKDGSKKRHLQVCEVEDEKRKRRRIAFTDKLSQQLNLHAQKADERFRREFQRSAETEVTQKEIHEEKERKKDMQRKRRREKTVQNETQKRKDAMERLEKATDDAERERLYKEAQRAEKKANHTKMILQGVNPDGDKLREVTPMAPNMEGGVTDSFLLDNSKRKGRGGPRPRKSKEQKQKEKDAAEAAHALLEQNQELPPIAPKETTKKEIVKKEPKVKEESPATLTPYVSKGYNQIYEQIWKDIARKDIPRVYRIKENSTTTKHSNLRKTAQLASKEARRWQARTNKSMKDVQARAKRSMREMMSFWKRNERQERDSRKMLERQEIDNAKRAEAEREANRQKRKLNFLISQTELYSHFIGKKIKTDEVERSTDRAEVAAAEKATQSTAGKTTAVSIPDPSSKPAVKVNFEDLDFGDDDETTLREAAMANAQHAIQEAQDKALSFNNGGQPPDMDDGELNFQNPTSLGEVKIEQPKMLTAQLKEYQLKGLNWLVNLYEQGINGILADEMGLGKTIQSISVMSYLAENHNIWGPFLVIAPASTLHNWQQEIARFVPDLKVLPYWGNAKDRKVLRKFWDRKHITYTQDSPFHVLVTSYQLVVQDTQYFQKIRWQYMILDEAQAIKSSQSSRWKNLLGFHCRNRLLLTGTPIQNNMQELWALLHFIMPSLFDNHDEFSEWFSKDIESHAQSNTKLNEDQLKRLHMILKPFMLRRVKKHVQKELGDKIEKDVVCDLTYRQRAYYTNLRNKISIMDLIEKAAVGDDQDTATLMNLVMQFRKVCNHPDLFERAETTSPFSVAHFAETASFLREGQNINVAYSTRNLIEFVLPKLVYREGGRLDLPGPDNEKAGFKGKYLDHLFNIWETQNIQSSVKENEAFSWLRFADTSAGEVYTSFHQSVYQRAAKLGQSRRDLGCLGVIYDGDQNENFTPTHAMLNIVERNPRRALAEITNEGTMRELLCVSKTAYFDSGLGRIEQCARPKASAPLVEVVCSSSNVEIEKQNILFNVPMRRVLLGPSEWDEKRFVDAKLDLSLYPPNGMLPKPISEKARFTNIQVPSMNRFVTDSGKLAKLDSLLRELKDGSHRVLLYFQMTRMIDLMEEYLTYRNYKYLRLDGSTKLEDRRDTVHDFQTKPEIFIFLLSTRAGGLGINLTSADTVIFYDSDWNPTIDSQAMDRAHRLGQTKQVTVYRMITRGTIEERIRKRALQKEEVQRVVIQGGSGGGVDFNTRSRENRTKDIAMWLADDDQAAEIERKEAEIAAAEAKEPEAKKRKKATAKRTKEVSLDDMYHEGEGHFDDGSAKPSGAATPVSVNDMPARGKRGPPKGRSKKAKSTKDRLRMADGDMDMGGL